MDISGDVKSGHLLSVIMPVLNEEKTVDVFLDKLLPLGSIYLKEIIVVDGGSDNLFAAYCSRGIRTYIKTMNRLLDSFSTV